MAEHCRYILYGSWLVSVEEELTYTRNFMEMQNMKYNAGHILMIDVEDKCLDCEIPILAIQIFVENSLKYSRLSTDAMEIHISVTGKEMDGLFWIHIEIDDYGAGFDEETLALLNDPDSKLADAGRGIGIDDVRRRIEILYGAYSKILNSRVFRH